MKVVIGSKSQHKFDAVTDAWEDVCFGRGILLRCVSAPSEIPEQPSGLEQTHMGASNRARNAMKMDDTGDLYIGIESGIVGSYGRFYDIAFVVILMKDGTKFSAMAGGHEVPKEFVDEAHQVGFAERTAGAVMAERTGCSSTDGTSFVSSGAVSRKDTLTQAVAIALGDWKRQAIQ